MFMTDAMTANLLKMSCDGVVNIQQDATALGSLLRLSWSEIWL